MLLLRWLLLGTLCIESIGCGRLEIKLSVVLVTLLFVQITTHVVVYMIHHSNYHGHLGMGDLF
jgi:hypothetical protein